MHRMLVAKAGVETAEMQNRLSRRSSVEMIRDRRLRSYMLETSQRGCYDCGIEALFADVCVTLVVGGNRRMNGDSLH